MNITLQLNLDLKLDDSSPQSAAIEEQLVKVKALIAQANIVLSALTEVQSASQAPAPRPKMQRTIRHRTIEAASQPGQEANPTKTEVEQSPLADLSSPALYLNGHSNDTSTGAAAPTSVSKTPSDGAIKSNRLSFEQLDHLVRLEMKRLSIDGRMPSYKLWDSERQPPLPTLGALIIRYKATGLADLAQMLNMRPPLSINAEPVLA